MNDELTAEITEGEAEAAALPEEETPTEEESRQPPTDFASLAEEDLAVLREEFPELAGLDTLRHLPNPGRFGELRELGLTPREAYLATMKVRRTAADNRSHLHSSVPRFASGQIAGMTGSELTAARDLFGTMTDSEIQKLYKRVTK